MRVVAFTDYVYRKRDGVVYGERAFALFLAALTDHVTALTIVGRLDPAEGACHYPLPAGVGFVALPHYPSLTRPLAVVRSLVRSLLRFWRTLEAADTVWLLGPYPHAVAFAILTRLRRRRLILGVRQDFPQYVRSRRPTRRWMHRAADLLELSWRALARTSPVIVVGSELERHYRHAPATLQITVSLITAADVDAGQQAATRSYDGELQLLSVGRIDREKNPLLLAEIVRELRSADPRWKLVLCGEGPLLETLMSRVAELGLNGSVDPLGYVPIDGGLLDLYRRSHAFLHVSLTEGMPQVLLEAFASGVPVVATAVGGVPETAGGAAVLIPPDDAAAAAQALLSFGRDRDLRRRLMSAGFAVAKQHTREAEIARVASFLAGDGVPDEDGKEIAGHPRRSGERSREKADGADRLA